eukprot:scaffold63347_cov58-Phaeocystis_antarctica.AAC.1
MTAEGKTSISDGFEAAGLLFADNKRPSAAKVLLLLSDGEQTVDKAPGKTLLETAIDAAALVKSQGVTVFAWGFGENVSLRTLQGIATGRSKAILAQNLTELTSYLVELEADVCNESPPSLPPSPSPPPRSPPPLPSPPTPTPPPSPPLPTSPPSSPPPPM